MNDFMQDHCKNGLSQENFDQVALELNNLLMERQERESPVTLNSLLSSWILQEKNPSMQMSTLVEKSRMTYNYMRQKPWFTTHMGVEPMNPICELTVKGLGFKTN